jgi:hypothetical protein
VTGAGDAIRLLDTASRVVDMFALGPALTSRWPGLRSAGD